MSIKTISNAYGIVNYDDDLYSSTKSLTAIANDGYAFASWQGDVSSEDSQSNPLFLQYIGDQRHKNITALFRQNISYVLTIGSSSSYGSATINDFPGYPSHKEVIATANAGYIFSQWNGDYVTNSNKTNNPIQIYMNSTKPTASLYPTFAYDPRYTVLTLASGAIRQYLVEGQLTYQSIGYSSLITGDRSNIIQVSLGTGVTSIANDCFNGFTSLTSIQFSQVLDSIGDNAFYNCASLTSFDFTKVHSLSKKSFYNTGLISLVSFNSSIIALPEECFYNCTKLQNIVIPTHIASIGQKCFFSCNKLVSIDFRAFSGSLPKIYNNTFDLVGTISNRIIYLKSEIETQVAYDDDIWTLFYADIDPQLTIDTQLSFKVKSKQTLSFVGFKKEMTIPVNVNFGDGQSQTYINNNYKVSITHKYNKAYSSVQVLIDNSLSSIDFGMRSAYLVGIQQFGSAITYIPQNFLKKSSITSFEIPRTVLSIDNPLMWVSSSSNLPAITAQNGNSIGTNWLVLRNGDLVNIFALNNVTTFNAENITSLTHLTRLCFFRSSSLTTIKLPNSITKATDPLVSESGCTKLTSITIQSGGSFFVSNGMLMSNDGKIYMSIHSPGEIINTATRLMRRAFTATSLTSISLPPSLTHIASDAFCNNPNLASISVPGMTKETAQEKIEDIPWIYGGPDYYEINGDDKKNIKEINIACSNGSLTYVAITDEQGYLKKSLTPEKVKCLTVTNEYIGSSNPLYGMTLDSDRLETMLNGYASVTKMKNSDATKLAVTAKITELISSLGDDGLFIFHDGGHGGNDDGKQYMVLYNNVKLYDYEFWNLIKNARCKVMTIFCTCHSGTMFQAIFPEEFNNRSRLKANDIDDEDAIKKKQKSWVTSAKDFFSSMPSYDQDNNQIVSGKSNLLQANAPEDFEPRLCVYGACDDEEVSYMEYNVGHCLMTSIVENFNRNNKLDSYKSLFDNSTTDNEKSRCIIYNDPIRYVSAPDEINPQYYVSDGFDDNIRVFT